jgi:hypothetical protein
VPADAIETLDTIHQALRCVDRAERGKFVAEHRTDAQAELLGLRCGRGVFGNHAVDDSMCQQVPRSDALFGCHVRGVVRVVVEDRACPLGRKRGQPAMLGGEDPIGRHECECPAAGSLAEKH